MTVFQISRYDPAKDAGSCFHTYRLSLKKGDTLLDCLDRIKSHQDGTLAYRSSCLQAVCGSCAVRVNGKPMLACRTQVAWLALEGTVIKIEPLRNFKVIRDLVVDLSPLYQQIQDIMPWLAAGRDRTAGTNQYATHDWTNPELDHWKCIMCASCYSECSLFDVTRDFYGPAALVAAYHFSVNCRDGVRAERIERLAARHGIWECIRCYSCSEACTQEIKHHEIINALSAMTDQHRPCRHAGARHARAFLRDIPKNGKLNEWLLAWRTAGLRLMAYAGWAVKLILKGRLNFRSPKTVAGINGIKSIYRAFGRTAE